MHDECVHNAQQFFGHYDQGLFMFTSLCFQRIIIEPPLRACHRCTPGSLEQSLPHPGRATLGYLAMTAPRAAFFDRHIQACIGYPGFCVGYRGVENKSEERGIATGNTWNFTDTFDHFLSIRLGFQQIGFQFGQQLFVTACNWLKASSVCL